MNQSFYLSTVILEDARLCSDTKVVLARFSMNPDKNWHFYDVLQMMEGRELKAKRAIRESLKYGYIREDYTRFTLNPKFIKGEAS